MTQAIGRARRFGQNKLVHIYQFVSLKTIDVDILEERTGKKVVQEGTGNGKYKLKEVTDAERKSLPSLGGQAVRTVTYDDRRTNLAFVGLVAKFLLPSNPKNVTTEHYPNSTPLARTVYGDNQRLEIRTTEHQTWFYNHLQLNHA
ncbi:MAG: hypothetical protein M1823_004887 [Watsoniomyces obsoletus]|nr:MAG: hypothetical protein M1823_004887 [Watsoniomyces obsoletus]